MKCVCVVTHYQEFIKFLLRKHIATTTSTDDIKADCIDLEKTSVLT